MERSDVEGYVERSASLIESSPQMNEENTKAKIIRPLIELLGWDIYSGDVELEYSMQIGRGNTRADYALLLEGTPVVFIEAKGCDTTLSDSARSQLKSYMRQTGVDWGLLTNGAKFEILKRRTDSKRPDEVVMGTPSLEELVSEYELLKLLSKDLVQSGEADKIAERMEATKRAVGRLQNNKERIAEQVTKVIVDEIGEVPPQEIQALSKEYVDDIINTLEANQQMYAEPELSEPVSTEVPSTKHSSANSIGDEPGAVEGYYSATLYDGESTQESFTEETQSGLMAAVTDYLIREHGLVTEIGPLPYVPGKKNAILSTEPRHPSGETMRLYETLSNGYSLYTSLNKQAKERNLRKFAESCDLTIEFDED